MSTLRDDEKYELHEAVDRAENCGCCGGDYGWDHVYANVSALIEARVAAALTKQAEDIAAAIEAKCGDDPIKPRYTTANHVYATAARIAREFGQQKEADCG